MDWPFEGLTPGKYGALIADPPWSFRAWSRKDISRMPDAHYPCQSLEWIQSLPVADLAAPDCALIMWATAPMLPQAIETLTAWGFAFKSAGSWAKQTKTGKAWQFGTGYVFRSASEFYLLGTRGAPRAKSRSIRNLVVAPVREHSRKPDQMRADVEALFDGPYAELFAREAAPNWDAWGNQTDRFTSPSRLRKQELRESVL